MRIVSSVLVVHYAIHLSKKTYFPVKSRRINILDALSSERYHLTSRDISSFPFHHNVGWNPFLHSIWIRNYATRNNTPQIQCYHPHTNNSVPKKYHHHLHQNFLDKSRFFPYPVQWTVTDCPGEGLDPFPALSTSRVTPIGIALVAL